MSIADGRDRLQFSFVTASSFADAGTAAAAFHKTRFTGALPLRNGVLW